MEIWRVNSKAIIAYVVYSQVLKGAEYMNIAGELEKHAGEELQHAHHHCQANRIIFGGTPTVQPEPVKSTGTQQRDVTRGSKQ